MSSLDQRLFEGDRAREVLENEAFAAAFDATEKEVVEQWTNSPARDIEGRERLWMMLALLRKVKSSLRTTLETGMLAAKELEHRRSIAERVKQWAR